MKKVFISLFGLILSIGAWAQCPTEGTEAYPVPVDSSLLTINGARRADCDAYIKGSYNPLYIHRCGVPSNGYYSPSWYYGLLSESDISDSGYNIGIVGRVLHDGSHTTSGRAYGVMGTATGYASGYTYGLFGRLEGTRNGAGVFGTSYLSDNGVDTGARYAGFFHGNVRVTETLNAATVQANSILVPAPSGTSLTSTAAYSLDDAEESPTTCQKLEGISAYTFLPDQPVVAVTLENDADTVDYASLTLYDEEFYSRTHHGLSPEEVEEVYPELVYEDAEGNKSVNYLELIPILLDAVKELRGEVEMLKGNSANSPSYSRKRAQGVQTGIGHVPAEGRGTSGTVYNLHGQRTASPASNTIAISEDGLKSIVK